MSQRDYIRAKVEKALSPQTLARLASHDAKRASMYRAAMEAPKPTAAPKLVSTRRAGAPGVLIPSRKAPAPRYRRSGGDTGGGPGWIGSGNS